MGGRRQPLLSLSTSNQEKRESKRIFNACKSLAFLTSLTSLSLMAALNVHPRTLPLIPSLPAPLNCSHLALSVAPPGTLFTVFKNTMWLLCGFVFRIFSMNVEWVYETQELETWDFVSFLFYYFFIFLFNGHIMLLMLNCIWVCYILHDLLIFISFFVVLWLVRLQNVTPISYAEEVYSKKDKFLKDEDVRLEVGAKPEVYTEEHMKLLTA